MRSLSEDCRYCVLRIKAMHICRLLHPPMFHVSMHSAGQHTLHTMLQGSFTLLLGPPGSGKSTLLRALTGRLKRAKNLEVGAFSSSRCRALGHTLNCRCNCYWDCYCKRVVGCLTWVSTDTVCNAIMIHTRCLPVPCSGPCCFLPDTCFGVC